MKSEKEFREIWLRNISYIEKYLTRDIYAKLARYNQGNKRMDFVNFYKIEWRDYWEAYKLIYKSIGEKGKVCDCGGFLGVFALVLAEIGYDVSIVEALKYYNEVFDDLYVMLSEKNISIIDYDLFDYEHVVDIEKKYDVVLAMAMVEHYPYSLKKFLNNLKSLTRLGGYIYITAPNIAVFHKRINLMLYGKNPNASIKEIWNSEIPFTGHCHEMTMEELEIVAKLSKLKIVEKIYVSGYYYGSTCLSNCIYKFIHDKFPSTRENLGIWLKKVQE